MSNKAFKKNISSLLIAILVMSHVFTFDILKTEAAQAIPPPPDPGYANLAGMVINSKNNEPLFGAVISIISRENLALYSADYYDESSPLYHVDNWAKETLEQTTTDADGFYSILNTFWCNMNAGGNWFMDLETSKDGYATTTVIDINPVCGETNTFNAALTPTEIPPAWRQNILPGDILYDPFASGVGHTGLYVGNEKVIEALGIPPLKSGYPGKVEENPITAWDYPQRDTVYLLRVNKPDSLSDTEWQQKILSAIAFVQQQQSPTAKPYDWHWYQKQYDNDSPSWYCSELVWAAYYNQDIDLEYRANGVLFDLLDPVSPVEIFDDADTEAISSHLEGFDTTPWYRQYAPLLVLSPVNVVITDKDGNIINQTVNNIPGATFIENQTDETGHEYSIIYLPIEQGPYQIEVVRKPDAQADSTYSLKVQTGNGDVWLAENEPVPAVGESDEYDFDPLTLNNNPISASGFSDIEKSSDSTYQAGTLDALFSSSNNFSPTTTPSQVATTTALAQNNGSLDFQYKISAENFSNDADLCAALNLQVKQSGAEIYNDILTNFYAATSTLATSTADNFDFTASLPTNADLSLRNKTCAFDLKLKSWQTGADDENSGFNDEEILSFNIAGGEWSATPPAPFVPGPGAVVINELMWMGNDENDGDEWLELKNTTAQTIDLAGWQLTKKASDGNETLMFTIPANQSIAPNGFFLAAEYDQDHSAIKVIPNLIVGAGDANGSDFALANTNLQIKLYQADWTNVANLIDAADDGTGAPAKGSSGSPKKSMERNDLPGNGALTANWHTCEDSSSSALYWDPGRTEQGTPGAANLSQNDPTAPDYNLNLSSDNAAQSILENTDETAGAVPDQTNTKVSDSKNNDPENIENNNQANGDEQAQATDDSDNGSDNNFEQPEIIAVPEPETVAPVLMPSEPEPVPPAE